MRRDTSRATTQPAQNLIEPRGAGLFQKRDALARRTDGQAPDRAVMRSFIHAAVLATPPKL